MRVQCLHCDIPCNILRAMVSLSASLVDILGDLAVDVREGFEAGVWAVDEALTLHTAFRDNNVPRSALVRAVIAREFRAGAERRGLNPRAGLGGATELYELSGNEYAVIRLRSAEEVAGELRVISNSGSTWGGLSDDGFWREVPYVFGCLVNSTSVEFFVAEVVGQSDAAVPHLEFGWVHRFTPLAPQNGSAFTPDDGESLEGWDVPDQGVIDKQV